MGMFDYVSLEDDFELPDGFNGNGVEFQTKSIHSLMDRFRITKAGRLQKWINDGWEGTGEFTDTKIFGKYEKQREINGRWGNDNYHGDVYFYTHEKVDEHHSTWIWREYRARFTEGVLHGPIVTKETIPDERDWHSY